MSARSFASGTISFGLISIPVKLYSTGEASAGIQLNMMHKGCGSRLRQQWAAGTHAPANRPRALPDCPRSWDTVERFSNALQPGASLSTRMSESSEILPPPLNFRATWKHSACSTDLNKKVSYELGGLVLGGAAPTVCGGLPAGPLHHVFLTQQSHRPERLEAQPK